MNENAIVLPEGDYVSPNHRRILLDKHFPNMIRVTDEKVLSQIHLLKTRGLYHNHYADKRHPTCGFVNRDEAHILYNTALHYKGRRALEIGCWTGWSTCHLLAGGVVLDVIDPILKQQTVRDSVIASVNSCGFGARLWPDNSPDQVGILAETNNLRWPLFFVDGNHYTPGPIVDAFICARYAEQDALILFHDLWQPAVADALAYLKSQGWQTMIYNTFAIMGVAWRGNAQPFPHEPDPSVDWSIPDNLKDYPVSHL
jgi:hypothetical protein